MARITVAVPKSMMKDANQMGRVMGRGPADERTYRKAEWKDAAGNLYSVSSGLVEHEFKANSKATLKEPNWKANIASAKRAQDKLTVWTSGETPVLADPNKIVGVMHDVGLEAAAMLGLERI